MNAIDFSPLRSALRRGFGFSGHGSGWGSSSRGVGSRISGLFSCRGLPPKDVSPSSTSPLPIVARWVDRSATIATDEQPDARSGLRVHIDTAASVPAMFKRVIIGIWQQISGKHMRRCLCGIAFRWHHRGWFEGRFATLLGTKAGTLAPRAFLA